MPAVDAMSVMCRFLALGTVAIACETSHATAEESSSVAAAKNIAEGNSTVATPVDPERMVDAKWAKAHEIHETAMNQIANELVKEMEQLKSAVDRNRTANNTPEQTKKLDEAAQEIFKTAADGLKAKTPYEKSKAVLEGYLTFEKALSEAEGTISNTYSDEIRESRNRIARLNEQMERLDGMIRIIEQRDRCFEQVCILLPDSLHCAPMDCKSTRKCLSGRQKTLLESGYQQHALILLALCGITESELADGTILVEQAGKLQFWGVVRKALDVDLDDFAPWKTAPIGNLANVLLQTTHHDLIEMLFNHLHSASESLRIEKF